MNEHFTASAKRVRDASKYTQDESYMLLLELSTQEPILQSCLKIVQSTCLAQGIQMKIKVCSFTMLFNSENTR